MNNLKCYIDVNFTVEEDLSEFTNEEIERFLQSKDEVIELFKQDLLDQLDYSENIKDLDVLVTFEGDDE